MQRDKSLKFAVVGTGAAAFGAALALSEKFGQRAELELIGPDERSEPSQLAKRDPRSWTDEEYDGLHRLMRDAVGLKFPPPRTLFGETIDRYPLTVGKAALWRSEKFGGLANFWSGAMYPLTLRDWEKWDVSAAEFAPHYQRVAEAVGIAGRPDAIDAFYGTSYVNRPPGPCSPLNERLISAVNKGSRQHGATILAGVNRLAIETRDGHEQACVSCGECMYGCFRESLFRPGVTLRAMVVNKRLQHRRASVQRVEPGPQGCRVVFGDGSAALYDQVLLCAGAIGTSEILLRSFGAPGDSIIVEDNEMYMFGLVNLESGLERQQDYMSIANSVVGIMPDDQNDSYCHALVAPFMEYLINYYISHSTARVLSWLKLILKQRILLGKLYAGGASAAQFSLHLTGRNDMELAVTRRGRSNKAAQRSLKALSGALETHGFRMLPIPILRAQTSSHYVGSLCGAPLGLRVTTSGQLAPTLWVADSTAFPHSPAQPLTFTIMANAHRVAAAAATA
jgi:hypothetical protein